MIEWLFVLLPLVGVLYAYRRYPDQTRRWFGRVMHARRLLFMGFALLVALVFIGSGSPGLMFIGGLGLAYAALYVVYEQPHTEVRAWFGI